jgi:hypothetical protein
MTACLSAALFENPKAEHSASFPINGPWRSNNSFSISCASSFLFVSNCLHSFLYSSVCQSYLPLVGVRKTIVLYEKYSILCKWNSEKYSMNPLRYTVTI